MMIRTVAVENYRSLRRLVLPLSDLTVITGANGTGKSSVYRALRLLADTARDGAVAALAREGGLPSTMWAGAEGSPRLRRADISDPSAADSSAARSHGSADSRAWRPPAGRATQGAVRREPVALRLGYAGDQLGYAIDLGLPTPSEAGAFVLDPVIKREWVWAGPRPHPAAVVGERHNRLVELRDPDGNWAIATDRLRTYDSMLSALADPRQAPELLVVREALRSWRFYDQVRTDVGAPARSAQIGTRTPVLASDGSDLAAALQTILEIGDSSALLAAVSRAFPGSTLQIDAQSSRFEVTMRQRGMLRPLRGAELSDGTVRYLLWVAALLTPRPPELMVLNEPETSLHQELLRPLAELIRGASRHCQVVVVTHAHDLVQALRAEDVVTSTGILELTKHHGQTVIEGQGILDEPSWTWPKR